MLKDVSVAFTNEVKGESARPLTVRGAVIVSTLIVNNSHASVIWDVCSLNIHYSCVY